MMRHIRRMAGMLLLALGILLGGYGLNSMAVQAADESQDMLKYLVIESPYIERTQAQRIVVGIGDEDMTISDAQLLYLDAWGVGHTMSAEEINQNAILFRIEILENAARGQYQLTEIRYVCEGESHSILLETQGIRAGFGVETEIDGDPVAYVVPEEQDIEANVVTLDEEGNATSGISVADALRNALGTQEAGTFQSKSYSSNGKYVVVLDPGHGEHDPGATRTYNGVTYYERDIVLKIAQYCKAELEKTPGITVYLTRTDNTSTLMDRKERTNYAISKGANIIVSLHINATDAKVGTASGSSVYCPKKDTLSGELSQELADQILKELKQLGLKNRGKIVDESFGMIKYPKENGVPGILVEHAFINNPSDVSNYLSTDDQLEKLGKADAWGILEYLITSDLNYYSKIFDATYYAEHNSDLYQAFGNNKVLLLRHFVNYGMNEGRQGCATFNVYSYRNQYSDLRKAFGNNLKSYYLHFLYYGQGEGRTGTGCTSMQGTTSVYAGVDYSSVYDYNYYTTKYPDIKRAFGIDDVAVLSHFVRYGMSEGRQGNASFDVKSYRNRYADLRDAFGSDWESYYMHYVKYGRFENRETTGCSVVQGATTVYQGVDYSSIYDYYYYVETYTDIKRASGNDDKVALQHFVNYGMGEGRQASEEFDVKIYADRYADLSDAFGTDWKSYYLHYLKYGIYEGRSAK